MTGGELYIVATPIGNLGDITLNAVQVLKDVDVILCEDTRVTRTLLEAYQITTPTQSFHHHSGMAKMKEVYDLLFAGKRIALVTDAGTPGVSDPGNALINFLTASPGFTGAIRPVPGPSAVTAALSVCGFSTDAFLFLGFPPHKKGRHAFFQQVADARHTTVFYESSHRIAKTLAELGELLSEDRELCVCRELTKKFETIYRGTIKKILAMSIPEKGEFAVVVRAEPKRGKSKRAP